MATVTGLTAERTLQIEAALVVGLTIDASNHIILTKHDGSTIDCGPLPSSSATAQGVVELATTAEATAGTDTTRAVTPAGLAAYAPVATTSVQGKVELATTAETQTGTDTARAVTPAGLAATVASTTQKGVVQLATSTEVLAASSTAKPVVPATLAAFGPRNDSGIYIPPGWGQFWRPKRAAAGSALATVAFVGSSSTQGLYSSNLLTAPFVSKVMTDLQTTYGDGGSGYFHTARSLTFMGASTTANAWNAISGNFCTVNNLGNWSIGNPYGPGANYIYTTTVGDTITFIVRGTKIRVYTLSGAGRSNWSYTVDGGSSTAVTDSGTGSSSIQVTTITGLSAGSHTLVMTKTGSAGSSMAVCGVTGENATGIVVNNFGMSGASSRTFADVNSTVVAPGRWTGGPDYPADLVVYALGANDCNAGYTGDTWLANVQQFLAGVRDSTSTGGTPSVGNQDIVILMQHIGAYDSNYKWQDYCSRVRGLAEAYNAAVVNVWQTGRNSWNYWNSLNYWGNASASGGVGGTDTIHMSDAGHTATYNALIPVLKS